MDPDKRVQEAIRSMFAQFEHQTSIRQLAIHYPIAIDASEHAFALEQQETDSSASSNPAFAWKQHNMLPIARLNNTTSQTQKNR